MSPLNRRHFLVTGLAAGATAAHPFLKINPHLRFYNNQRGYVLTTIERDRLTADF